MTTAIAVGSALSAGGAGLQRRILPWVGGLLLGIGVFWILPEMAQETGWAASLSGVTAILLLLGALDHYVYPICPFCASGVHSHGASHASTRHTITLGWPLLLVGCLHSFFDGWAIGLSPDGSWSNPATAISWGVILHKIPESAAAGLLAARLTSSRKWALGTVALIQATMGAGLILAVTAGAVDNRWASTGALPACALLLLFGFLALQQEWRSHGGVAALRASIPGILGCGFAAVAMHFLAR